MKSSEIQNRILYTSIDSSEMPEDILEYQCDLIIEEDVNEPEKSRHYLKFQHKTKPNIPSFKIHFERTKSPSILMHVFKLEKQKFSLKGKISKMIENTVSRSVPVTQFQEVDSQDEDDEIYMEKKLDFNQGRDDDEDDDDYSDSSEESMKGVAPNDEGKNRARSKIIDILNDRGRIASIKELNFVLKTEHNIKIPESLVKELALKVCNFEKKSKGYTLKPQYVDNVRFNKGYGSEPRKRIKQDSDDEGQDSD